MQLGEGDKLRQAGHGAIVVHDLADHARREETRHAGDVHGSFRMAGADECAAFLGNQREDVAGSDDVVMILGRINGDGNRPGTVMCGNAGGDALFRFDGDGEGRPHAFAVVAGHHVEFERMGALLRHGEADEAPAMLGHEVYRFRRGEGGRDDEVALILAVFGINEYEHPAIAGVFDDFLD